MQSFGYVKRPNGSPAPNTIAAGQTAEACSPAHVGSRSTAHVTAVPRSNKVSGGTQTSTSDLGAALVLKPGGSSVPQPRSCSLTGPTAAQLNQSLRERLTSGSHSLPKQHHPGGSDLHIFQQHHRMSAAMGQHHQQHRAMVRNDGSVSDTQTYVEVKPDYSSYAAWLKHSNTATSRLSECDSMESLAMAAAAAAASGGGMQHGGRKLMHRDSSYSHSPRLNRSNSIR